MANANNIYVISTAIGENFESQNEDIGTKIVYSKAFTSMEGAMKYVINTLRDEAIDMAHCRETPYTSHERDELVKSEKLFLSQNDDRTDISVIIILKDGTFIDITISKVSLVD